MAPTLQKVLAGLALLTLACSTGIGTGPGVAIQRFQTGDYEVEYDGEMKKVTIGIGLLRIYRFPEDIEISDGVLLVGRRDYGPVAAKGKLSVVGGKVTFDGQERKPAAP